MESFFIMPLLRLCRCNMDVCGKTDGPELQVNDEVTLDSRGTDLIWCIEIILYYDLAHCYRRSSKVTEIMSSLVPQTGAADETNTFTRQRIS